MQVRALVSVIAVMIISSAALGDDKLDAAEKEISQKWKNVKSMSAKMTMDSEMKQGGMEMKSNMTAAVAYLRQGDKLLSRLEGEMDMVQKMGETEHKMNMPILAICDGELTHTLMERMGQKMCVKSKAEPQSLAGDALFKALHEKQNLTLAPDEEVDGQKCWVIQATPLEQAATQPGEPAKTVYYFRQKDGATAQILGYDAEGNKTTTAKFTEIKFDEKLDPANFEFKAPEGVQVMDMTNTP